MNEEKTHWRSDESDRKAKCGATGNAVRRITTSTHNVTCERCLKCLHAGKKRSKPLVDIL